jgi:hypothetical protein
MLNNAKPPKKLACGAFCCVAAAAAVAASPPGNSSGGLGSSAFLAATASRGPASRVEFQRLDLRPPETLPGGRASAPSGDASAAFPSAKRAQLGASAGAEADLPGAAPGGADSATLRMESKVQEMERRVPREGLPVARLWETKSALLHVGLSPRGKPGLWLIQKVP